jgi:uncharacterized iron-regulated membrane protein
MIIYPHAAFIAVLVVLLCIAGMGWLLWQEHKRCKNLRISLHKARHQRDRAKARLKLATEKKPHTGKAS